MRRMYALLMPGMLVLALLLPQTAAARSCFNETSYCIDGRIEQYWQQNGGLPVFGFPISAQAPEPNRDTGQTYVTQWFERNRFELHPENAAPYDVLLGRLGDDRLRQLGIDWQTLPKATPSDPHYFPQTGQAISFEPFWQYWRAHGLELGDRGVSERESLALFGYPISPARMETNSSGDTVLTQWFERARFEWHPNNPDPYKVLLGLLGNEVRSAPQPAPGQPPAQVRVLSHSWYRTDDIFHIVGEVRNDTAVNQSFVRIVASVYDSSGRLVATDTAYAELRILVPGQRAPFHALITQAPADIARYELQVEADPTQEQPLGGLTILSHTVRQRPYSGLRSIVGEVRNDSGGPVTYVELIVTLYNEQGTVVGMDTGYTSLEQLAPGQVSPFEILVLTWNNAVRYELQIQGQRP